MDISTIYEILEKYGVIGVLLVAALGGLWYLIRKQIEESGQNTTKILTDGINDIGATITEQNRFLITSIAEQSKANNDRMFKMIEKMVSRQAEEKDAKHAESINLRFKVTPQIISKLHDMMNYHNAQRSVIIEFHNSKENLNGLSFVWYDVQYETHQKTVIPICHNCKDLQVSNLYSVIGDILETGHPAIYKNEDITPDKIYHSNYEEIDDINCLVYSGIYNASNDLIGLIALEYIKDSYPEEFEIEDIIERSSAISTLLEFHHTMPND